MQYTILAVVAAAAGFAAAMPSPQAATCTSALCASLESAFTAPQPVLLKEFVDCCAGTTCVTAATEMFEVAGFNVFLSTGVRLLSNIASPHWHTYVNLNQTCQSSG